MSTQGGSSHGSILGRDDPDPDGVSIIFFPHLSQIFCTCTQKVTAPEYYIQKTRKVCNSVIKCKSIGGEEMKRQDDECISLNFNQLDQGCICSQIYFTFYWHYTGMREFVNSQPLFVKDIMLFQAMSAVKIVTL